ncbi:hypothetical protein CVT26_004007 [Gymnopilus dilepis]|uniref:F-box domain-containing protein n=1 Tax=Gymnopilus dilepis TaxID=231916 RepID=A0A409WPK1_9AGAR|nr:hypothetical protein CVT26_004007 [Gymnopilus dilepis]
MRAVSSLPGGIDPLNHTCDEACSAEISLGLGSRTSFDSLPVEIISIVFRIHAQENSQSGPQSCLRLGKICRRWRQIAWSTPDIWAKLVILPRHATSRTHFVLADEWLGRTGKLPLWIEFSSHRETWKPDPWRFIQRASNLMLKVLTRYSDRWYSVTLDLPSTTLEGIGSLSRTPSMLHHLSLEAIWSNEDDFLVPDYPRIPTFSNCSPKTVNISLLNVDLDWTSLTNLTLEFVDLAEVRHILPKAINLSECTLEEVAECGSVMPTVIGPVCPELKSLSVSFSDWEAARSFCNAIALPHLNYLKFKGPDADFSMDNLIHFLTQSSCTLKSLSINESACDHGSLIDLAPLLHTLTELRISGGNGLNGTDTFYHLLADPDQLSEHLPPIASSNALPYLPNLEKFTWEGCTPYPWDTLLGLLVPAPCNEASHRRPLKSVEINCIVEEYDATPSIPKAVLRQLSPFIDVEFKLTMSDWSGDPRMDLWSASLENSED